MRNQCSKIIWYENKDLKTNHSFSYNALHIIASNTHNTTVHNVTKNARKPLSMSLVLTLETLCTYILTPWSTVLLEKLTAFQLVKNFIAFYGTLRFITAFTRARHLSLSGILQSHLFHNINYIRYSKYFPFNVPTIATCRAH
jgi:prolipoprotein diacylglyceryltransferase